MKKKIVREIEQAAKAAGVLTRESLLSWAERHRKSAVASRLEWDDTKAGREYRLEQCRQLIVDVKCVIEKSDDILVRVRAYASLPTARATGGGYVHVSTIHADEQKTIEAIKQKAAEALAMVKAYSNFIDGCPERTGAISEIITEGNTMIRDSLP